MLVTFVLGLSTVLQFTAAALAARVIRRTGWSPAWALVSAAMLLIGARHGAGLYGLLFGAGASPPSLWMELPALAVSALLVAAIALLAPTFEARRRAEEAAVDSENRLRDVLDNANAVIYVKDTEGRYLFVNRRYENLFDVTNDRIKGQTDYDIFPAETADTLRQNDRDVIARGQRIEREEIVPHGREPHTYISVKFPLRTRAGEIYAVCGFSTDITEHKAAEEKLTQAQKLEAIGQLTGGVAHDFNNLLTVLIGNLEILEDRARNPDAAQVLQNAQKALARGAALTHRLLAYARQQPLRPEPTDVNNHVSEMIELLRRTLGEHIEIRTRLEPDLPPAVVDPSQLEDALLNLALNARDAMPDGGELTISTGETELDEESAVGRADISPGRYVTVSVSDTGEGIPAHHLDRVFDPFFTTKEAGKGSGLGLSMVYGFARQSGGHARIESEPGRGTTVRVLLPGASQPAAARAGAPSTGDDLAGRGETVLLVEDEDEVRTLATTLLTDLGYRVLACADAHEALDILSVRGRVDLLLADVVLTGGMSGPDLAAEAGRRRPGLPVLFVSGYSEAGVLDAGAGRDVPLLRKPFRREDLARSVRRALARERP